MREQQNDFSSQRTAMVDRIREEAAVTAACTGRGEFAENVVKALGKVPRHRFVPRAYREEAYRNEALPIDTGQTISQPFIVALMSDLLELRPDSVVLEVGCGSGYQAAILAELAGRVVSVEVLPELADAARARLAALGYSRVEVLTGDGYCGWPEYAPYDAIIVTAAAPEVPPPLVEQLRPGGRLVIPIGPKGKTQNLCCLEKSPDGQISMNSILPVVFVPFRHDEPTA